MATHLLILLTTSRCGQRSAELERLADSVERFRRTTPSIAVRHYLLLQAAVADDREAREFARDKRWTLRLCEHALGLSAARNRLLAELRCDPGLNLAVIAFPDDDAWYPDGALAGILTTFVARPALDLWCCRWGPNPSWPSVSRDRAPGVRELVATATSNTIFVRGSLAGQLGQFDESLGLGTPAVSGEDTDYALRAFAAARETALLPHVAIGHRAPDRRDRELYFAGAFYAISRHARSVPGGQLVLLRKMMVGIALAGMGRLTFGQLGGDLCVAFRLWRESCR